MLLLLSLVLGFLLLLWFETDVVGEYTEEFQLGTFSQLLHDFNKARKDGSPQTFVEYISLYHDCFIVRLVSCPKCLSTWLGGLTGLLVLPDAWYQYGFFSGIAVAGAIPYLTYLAFLILKKLQ